MEGILIMLLGFVVLLLGIYLRYRYKRKRYYQRFEPIQRIAYERKVLNNLGEEFMKFSYYLIIPVGVMIIFFGWFVHKEMKHRPATTQQP